MGYFNPVLQYGVETFCRDCAAVGVSGVILPDMPFGQYSKHYKNTFEKYNLCNICLVTPQTPSNRIRQIDSLSSGFIYAVSSSSTTGTKEAVFGADSYLQRLEEMQLNNPVLTGFNIKDRESFKSAAKHTRGGIIGSAFIRAISRGGDLTEQIQTFVKSIKP